MRVLGTARPAWHTPGYEALKDIIDLHVHPESCDEIAYIQQACQAGMKAVVFKSLSFPSIHEARLTQLESERYAKEHGLRAPKIFGGIVMDKTTVGGLNPASIKRAVRSYPNEMKVVWMPVIDSAGHLERQGMSKEDARMKGIYILKNGKLVPEAQEIVNLAAEYNLIISCGHMTIEEMMVLIDEGVSAGIKWILVDHPCLESVAASLDDQKEMARKGAFINHAALQFDVFWNMIPPHEMARYIKEVGAEHCTLCTDVGLAFMWNPVEAMRIMIWYLRGCGISQEEIDIMGKRNSARILGIE